MLSEEDRRNQAEADLRSVMSTASGRRFVWRVLENGSGFLDGTFTSDALALAFNAGKRAVGVALFQELQRIAPGEHRQMLDEHLRGAQEAAMVREAEADRAREEEP